MPRRTPTIRNAVLEDALEQRADGNMPPAPIVVGSPAWFAWLATHAGFRFESPVGTFTARRERRGGGWYWYAARRRHGTMRRTYLGKAEDLTLARLTAAAATLAVVEPADFPPLRTADRHPTPASAHSAPILSTKLAVPRLRAPLVARERLLHQLDAGLSHKLTLLSAPAGFGKTTLVAAWLAQGRDQHEFPKVAWVALDGGDNDPVRFWRYMLTACQAFDADIGQSALPPNHPPNHRHVVTTTSGMHSRTMTRWPRPSPDRCADVPTARLRGPPGHCRSGFES